ncbi:MAG: rhodanese-like domain-containing protein [Dethiosulfovibrio sp.]|nr:rhodanese-like domain-containing protein [Dethiosulfovibrio sp.]
MDQFTVTIEASSGGSVSPIGPVPMDKGTSRTFTFRPDSGKDLERVTINDIDVTAESKKTTPYSYTVESIASDALIRVTFTGGSLPDPSPSVGIVDRSYVKSNVGKAGFVLVDVRPKDYFDGLKTYVSGATAGHIAGAINVPLASLKASSDLDLASVGLAKDKTVIVYCNIGGTSAAAATALLGRGYGSVKDYSGGMRDWGSDPNEVVAMSPLSLNTSDSHVRIVSLDVLPDAQVSWTVGDSSVLSLNKSTGPVVEVTGIKAGTSSLTATIAGQAKAQTDVTVASSAGTSSSSGCNVGFAPLGVLMLMPVFAMALRKR